MSVIDELEGDLAFWSSEHNITQLEFGDLICIVSKLAPGLSPKTIMRIEIANH